MKRIYGRINAPQWDEGEVEELDEKNIAGFRFPWLDSSLKQLKSMGIYFHHGLDVGARNGPASAVMLQYVDAIDAIELHKQSCDVINSKFNKDNTRIKVINSAFGKWSPDDYKYDVIVMFEVLEHMQDPFYAVEIAYDLLENGGYLFITTPEQDGVFGVNDNNHDHYWTATAQSIVGRVFYDDRRWKIIQIIVPDKNIIYVVAQKRFIT
jgi:2-polyprenyl-3-methyl-5-hydroxy-6-metoxy-1,4-benzoquinol methylase